MLVMVRRVVGITIRDFGVALWPATTGIAVMVPAVLMALEAAGPTSGEIVRLAAGVAVGAVSYVGMVLLLHRRRLLMMLAGLRHGGPDHEWPAAAGGP
jgi:hypothetical protein